MVENALLVIPLLAMTLLVVVLYVMYFRQGERLVGLRVLAVRAQAEVERLQGQLREQEGRHLLVETAQLERITELTKLNTELMEENFTLRGGAPSEGDTATLWERLDDD